MQVELKTHTMEHVPIKLWKFPAGEVGVKIEGISLIKNTVRAIIYLNDASSDSIMAAINLADACYRIRPAIRTTLITKYLPYSRQDRVCHPGESFGLEVFIEILSQVFSEVITEDVHSAETDKLMLEHYINFDNIPQGVCASKLPGFDYFVAPDAGAMKKIGQHRQVKTGSTKVVQLPKTRKDGKVIYDDLKSGTLSGKVCVVDDLCDGGATFLSLGQMLRRTQPDMTELSLYVTHGLFTNGIAFVELYDLYDTIYVHNLMNEKFAPYIERI